MPHFKRYYLKGDFFHSVDICRLFYFLDNYGWFAKTNWKSVPIYKLVLQINTRKVDFVNKDDTLPLWKWQQIKILADFYDRLNIDRQISRIKLKIFTYVYGCEVYIKYEFKRSLLSRFKMVTIFYYYPFKPFPDEYGQMKCWHVLQWYVFVLLERW